ncbi:hypothetical protein K443DRAFT_415058 [Laccaria amethystina LaAM-08-1]|uniref:Uncharacterized protein n=1 Tax=Laccaria amethystina LaAM-08-1 TaxID=1095629 RepID=A0A0C9X9I3_9AGAR|nr:hypothetical protein K443DRAFT_415058 [Laccaria amethystina LaAM-08-1]
MREGSTSRRGHSCDEPPLKMRYFRKRVDNVGGSAGCQSRMWGVDEDSIGNRLGPGILITKQVPSSDDKRCKPSETLWLRLYYSLALHFRSWRLLPVSRLVEPIMEGMRGGDQVGRGGN